MLKPYFLYSLWVEFSHIDKNHISYFHFELNSLKGHEVRYFQVKAFSFSPSPVSSAKVMVFNSNRFTYIWVQVWILYSYTLHLFDRSIMWFEMIIYIVECKHLLLIQELDTKEVMKQLKYIEMVCFLIYGFAWYCYYFNSTTFHHFADLNCVI